MSSETQVVDGLVSRVECEQILHRLMMNIDRFQSLENLDYFTEDVSYKAAGWGEAHGHEELRGGLVARDAMKDRHTMNVVAGFDFTLQSADEASAVGNYLRWVAGESEPAVMRYKAIFVRKGGTWKVRDWLATGFPA
ncbi:nuclear transport factor 2 family protein [Williamsia soli]|uniref:nuclear transport factor 2 family protein n=1 Tax=Williamsia soli TaxID=364929 RepID=UPI001A9D7B6A|nr:nuclear transport factor 2 family protein [Williamsia soli]